MQWRLLSLSLSFPVSQVLCLGYQRLQQLIPIRYPWRCETDRTVPLSLAWSIRAAHTRSKQSFFSFCKKHGWDTDWLVATDMVKHFCVLLHQTNLLTDTISNRLVAVAFVSKAAGFPDPCALESGKHSRAGLSLGIF